MFPCVIFSQSAPKIAIIGGGIGGTSSAFFLQQLFQNKATISLFEKDTIGGRLRTMDVGGYKYEAGGSVIDSSNQYMVQFSKLLGLGVRQPQSSKLGIYNGEKFVFKESDWYCLTVGSLLWHYGLSIFYLFKDVKTMLNDFSKIYYLQEKGYAYTSVDQLLNSMNPDFLNMTRKTISEILLEAGYPKNFIDELVQSVMMVNYGQTNDVSGFVGYVSLAGAGNSLWSVEGGNKQVPEGLLKHSNANFLKANVLEVELLSDKKFLVKYQESSTVAQVKSDKFDIVILCAPLIKDRKNIKFVNFNKDFQQFERKYHQTVSTFVKGNLNPAAFNEVSLPEDILTNNNTLIFNSIGKCSPVDNIKIAGNKSVYKVFSQKPLNKESIEKLFTNVDVVKEKVWLAYPHYEAPEKFVPFILHPGLYYTNAIELSASAMEMSAVSAKNIALLIHNLWTNSVHKIDSHKPVLKDEL